MGLLDFEGEPLEWKDLEPYVDHVKKHGIIQFLNNYERLKKRPEDILKWGDEVWWYIYVTLNAWVEWHGMNLMFFCVYNQKMLFKIFLMTLLK